MTRRHARAGEAVALMAMLRLLGAPDGSVPRLDPNEMDAATAATLLERGVRIERLSAR